MTNLLTSEIVSFTKLVYLIINHVMNFAPYLLPEEKDWPPENL